MIIWEPNKINIKFHLPYDYKANCRGFFLYLTVAIETDLCTKDFLFIFQIIIQNNAQYTHKYVSRTAALIWTHNI